MALEEACPECRKRFSTHSDDTGCPYCSILYLKAKLAEARARAKYAEEREEEAVTARQTLACDLHRAKVELAEAREIIGWWESERIHHCKDGMLGIVVDGHGHGPLAPAEAYARLAAIDAGKDSDNG